MKKLTYFILSTLLFPMMTMAQIDPSLPIVEHSGVVLKSSGLSILQLIKINDTGEEIISNYLLIDASNIQKLERMEKEEATKRFGFKSQQQQAWIITPKPSAKIVSLSEYYEIQKLNSKFKKLPVSIDGKFIADTTSVFIDVNSVERFKASSDSIRLTSKAYATQ